MKHLLFHLDPFGTGMAPSTTSPSRSLSVLLLAALLLPLGSGCAGGVQRRQEALTGIHEARVENRATSIQARDARMNSSRQVWFQDY